MNSKNCLLFSTLSQYFGVSSVSCLSPNVAGKNISRDFVDVHDPKTYHQSEIFQLKKHTKQEAKMALNRSPGFRGTKLERCSRLCGFREKYFLRLFYISLCKTDKPRGGAIFGHGVII